MFRVNFDNLGGMTLDEWLAEEDTPGGRHATIEKKENKTYEMLRNEKTAVSQTKWAINCFTNWWRENCSPEDHDQSWYEWNIAWFLMQW